MRRVFRSASVVVANSRSTSSMLQKAGVRDDRIEIVYPGVDTRRFRPNIAGAMELRARFTRPGEVLIVSIGRLQRRKGHDLVLEALSRVGASDPKIRYIVVGDGDERLRLEEMATRLKINERVSFVGSVPADELPAFYAAADIFVHPNRIDGSDVEGFGIVFLEAAASGLAAIGGNSGGVPEAVVHNETGILVSGLDPEELKHALISLASSETRRLEMGLAGRIRAERQFSWEQAAEKMVAIHERVAGDQKKAELR
jgi:phosphatidylinositol alpha-1,6-mannosyltransferase